MHRRLAGFVFVLIHVGIGCTQPTITKGDVRPGSESEAEESTPSDSPPTENGSGASETRTDDTGDTGDTRDTGFTDTRPCSSGEPMLEIGTGETVFETIRDGDTIEVIHGTQDGHHILGSLRTRNTASIAAVRFQIIPTSDGIAISDQTYRLMMLPDGSGEPCAWSTIGMYAYLGRIDPGDAPFLRGSIQFQMDFEDDYGRTLSQSVELYPYVTPVERDPPTTESTSATDET